MSVHVAQSDWLLMIRLIRVLRLAITKYGKECRGVARLQIKRLITCCSARAVAIPAVRQNQWQRLNSIQVSYREVVANY